MRASATLGYRLSSRVEELSYAADQRFVEVSARILSLQSVGPLKGEPPPDNALGHVVAALQREVDAIAVDVARSLSIAEETQKILPSKVDPIGPPGFSGSDHECL